MFVLTYRPLTTKTTWKIFENYSVGKNSDISIIRLPWIPGLFYKLVTHPLLEFIYLFPGLFFTAPFVILRNDVDVIHGHGLIAGLVAVIWGNIFHKRVIVSTHSIYHFPQKSNYTNLSKWIFSHAKVVLALSKQATEEIHSLGVPKDKIKTFTYWIDLDRFVHIKNAKEKAKLKKNFTVLFVGRLVPEKGIRELLEASLLWKKKITLLVIGTGPLEDEVKEKATQRENIVYVGKVSQEQLPLYFSAADVFIIPSTHEEGYGRVILEALACGTPVIGSNRGAISEAMDTSVGFFISATPESIKRTVETCFTHPKTLQDRARHTRSFVEKRASEKNANIIVESYQS